MTICWLFTTQEPTWYTVAVNTAGKVRGWGEANRIITFSRKKETPMAVIRIAIRGALRMGRYATRSMTIPARAAPIMERISAGKKDSFKMDVQTKPI